MTDSPTPPEGPEIFADGALESALAEVAAAQDRPYFDADADDQAAQAYYDGVPPEEFGRLVVTTHARMPRYKPAVELYPWVDLQPDRMIRSLYTGQVFEPAELVRADFEIARRREQEVTRITLAAADQEFGPSPAQAAAEAEQALPFNCEHVVPQSWFGKAEPMRGDLHHLFACESRCNSFRGNTPYTDFPDFPMQPVPVAPGRGSQVLEVVRDDCGKTEGEGFEPAHGKGAAARAVFYFLLRYPGTIEAAEMAPEVVELLLGWHEQDPVSLWERHRNAAIHERQGNRNPFVDHPDRAGELVPPL